MALFHEIGNQDKKGGVRGDLGIAYASLGEADKAIECHEKALVLARELGERKSEGARLCDIGAVHTDLLPNPHKGIELIEKALIIFRETKARDFEGIALGNLGVAYANLDDLHEAIDFFEKQVEIERELGDRSGEGKTLSFLGKAYQGIGEREKARNLGVDALRIFRSIKSSYVETMEKWLADLGEER